MWLTRVSPPVNLRMGQQQMIQIPTVIVLYNSRVERKTGVSQMVVFPQT